MKEITQDLPEIVAAWTEKAAAIPPDEFSAKTFAPASVPLPG